MMASSAEGAWEVGVVVTDISVDRSLTVRGDLHIGGLMLQLVNSIEDQESKDWSDHALWWPDTKTWLVRTRWTLDKCGVSAGTTLWFTPMHKTLRVTLPDLHTVDARVNFSINVFNNVIALCKKYRIRHPEELSLQRSTSHTSDHGKSESAREVDDNRRTSSGIASACMSPNGDAMSVDFKGSDTASADIMLGRSIDNLFDANDSGLVRSGSHTASLDSLASGLSAHVTSSSYMGVRDAVRLLGGRPSNFVDRAKLDSRWLDSSKSLMEQDVLENDRVNLSYKFCVFFDLKPKYDAVRINQIYEHAKWSLISEHVDCTDEEAVLFAGLQLHVQLQQPIDDEQTLMLTPDTTMSHGMELGQVVDDVDAALDDLQMALNGDDVTSSPTTLLNRRPELHGYQLVYHRKKLAMKRYKIRFVKLREMELMIYHDAEHLQQPLLTLNLQGCDVSGLAKVYEKKFTIKLSVSQSDGTTFTELWLRIDTLEQYAEWLAAFRLASKSHTMADGSYQSEVESILDLLRLRQQPSPSDSRCPTTPIDIDIELFVPASCARKLGRKQVTKRIMTSRQQVQHMTSLEAKMTYIKAWQRLTTSGRAYFIATFRGCKKKELVVVGPERVERRELSSGQCVQTWPYSSMTSWSVNWTSKTVKVELETEKGRDEVVFQCLSADCKTIHEFIGGYVFVSMRSLDKNQTLDEKLFQKLTGGWR